MARPPRGGSRGSSRAADVRGTLGSLIKSTLAQAGVVREVIERGAREGRSRLDEARAGRRRHDTLAELGEVMLDLIRRGEIDLGELPEVRDIVADLDELDAHAPPRRGRSAWDHAAADAPELPELAMPPSRSRFDDRARGGDDGTVSSGARAPAAPRVRDHSSRGAAAKPPDLPKAMPHPHKGGGITFDDDDLADYMHPDDVPAKASSGDKDEP